MPPSLRLPNPTLPDGKVAPLADATCSPARYTRIAAPWRSTRIGYAAPATIGGRMSASSVRAPAATRKIPLVLASLPSLKLAK